MQAPTTKHRMVPSRRELSGSQERSCRGLGCTVVWSTKRQSANPDGTGSPSGQGTSWVLTIQTWRKSLICWETQHADRPNSIPIDQPWPSGAPYLVMEFVEGRSLREVLEAGPLPPQRAARMVQQLASALDAIHAQEICHRDVKPEN